MRALWILLFLAPFASTQTVVLKAPIVTNFGKWEEFDNCPPNTYAVGFRLKVQKEQGEKDDTALNGIRFYCLELENLNAVYLDTAQLNEGWSTYGHWDQDKGDDLAATNFAAFCGYPFGSRTTANRVEGDGLPMGDWTASQLCPENHVVHSISSQIDSSKSNFLIPTDFAGLNNVKLHCKKVTKVSCTPSFGFKPVAQFYNDRGESVHRQYRANMSFTQITTTATVSLSTDGKRVVKDSQSYLFILFIAVILCVCVINSPYRVNSGLEVSRSMHDKQMNKPTKEIVEMYQQQSVQRRSMFLNENMNIANMYNNMAPEVFCAEEIKVGTTDDGGKWMCGPYNLPENCAIFTLGLQNSITFEQDLQNMTNQRCQVIGVDKDDQTHSTIEQLKKMRGSATKATISKETDKSAGKYSMKDLLDMHKVTEVEILKIDIEGSEFDVLPDFLNQYRVSQILIEIHGNVPQTVSFLRMISTHGYLLFHYEINGGRHEFAEYAFIHDSVLERYDATLLAKYLS